ncbi:MAG: PQQ-binding-like beta-propeller repeat protein [Vicinamibacteria bacterium]
MSNIRRLLALGACALLGACGTASAPVPVPSPSSPADAGSATADAWPMYGHDAQRTNYNPAEKTITTANVGQLVVSWTVDVGTSAVPSNSAPTVANGHVYVGSSVAQGSNFFAFDATTGQLVWGADLHYTFDASCDIYENVGIPSTAAVANGVVIVGGGDAAYYGLDEKTGVILWRHDLNVGRSGFAWESPLVANGRAYIGISTRCDNPPVRGEVRALDIGTGTLLANQFFIPPGVGGASVWNSPAMTTDGKTLVVATGEDNGDHSPYEQAIVTLDATTLQILSANRQGATGQDDDLGTSPVVFHDANGRTLVAASIKGGTTYAWDLASLASGPIWQRNAGAIVGLAPAYDPTAGPGGTLFFGGYDGDHYTGGNGLLYAVDPATGADRWPPFLAGNMAGNVAIAGGLVFVNTGTGGVAVLDDQKGTVLTVLHPANPAGTFSGVTVTGGTVYWKSGQFLNAWRPS